MLSLEAVAGTLIPHIGGVLGGLITYKKLDGFYRKLKKPSWNPPRKAFPIAWTSLYTSMGYASYLVWKHGGGFQGSARLPLICYGIQLGINWMWTPIFFGMEKIGLALVDVSALWISIAVCIFKFHPISPTASYLMLPYLAWVTLATALNYNIWKNNKPKAIEDK